MAGEKVPRGNVERGIAARMGATFMRWFAGGAHAEIHAWQRPSVGEYYRRAEEMNAYLTHIQQLRKGGRRSEPADLPPCYARNLDGDWALWFSKDLAERVASRESANQKRIQAGGRYTPVTAGDFVGMARRAYIACAYVGLGPSRGTRMDPNGAAQEEYGKYATDALMALCDNAFDAAFGAQITALLQAEPLVATETVGLPVPDSA